MLRSALQLVSDLGKHKVRLARDLPALSGLARESALEPMYGPPRRFVRTRDRNARGQG